jgi:hypothetical protein
MYFQTNLLKCILQHATDAKLEIFSLPTGEQLLYVPVAFIAESDDY